MSYTFASKLWCMYPAKYVSQLFKGDWSNLNISPVANNTIAFSYAKYSLWTGAQEKHHTDNIKFE